MMFNPITPNPINNFDESAERRSNRDGGVGGGCFRCKEQGHWARDCPNKTPNKCPTPPTPQPTRFLGPDGIEYSPPSFLCRCGVRCPVKISKTVTNPNRKFYSCPTKGCNTFKWEDKVGGEELVHVPRCDCGAGFCRLCVETCGVNAGRRYFACPIKKGQGACAFYRLIEGELLTSKDLVEERTVSPQITLIDHNDTSRTAENVQAVSFNHEVVEIESSDDEVIAPNSQNQGASSSQLEIVQLMEMGLEGEEGTSNEPTRNRTKRVQRYGSSLNSVMECIEAFLSTEFEIHLRQKEFLRQISIEGNAMAASTSSSHTISYPSNVLQLREDWMVTAVRYLNIGLLEGWWGRLAYPPSRCLVLPAPKPFFCGVFPSYDPIIIPQSEDKVNFQPSSLISHRRTSQVGGMNSVISEGFARLAKDLQNQLISLLESTECDQHKSMDREAKITFAALNQLQIGCQPLCNRVETFIKYASSLAEIQGSVLLDDRTCQELREHSNSKKRRFDDISHNYHDARADLETSRERLQYVREEVSHVKDMLFQVEAELSCRVAENRYHEARFVQISKELMESEQAYQVAFKAAEEASEHFQRRKEEQNVAEIAFKKAKVQLQLIV